MAVIFLTVLGGILPLSARAESPWESLMDATREALEDRAPAWMGEALPRNKRVFENENEASETEKPEKNLPNTSVDMREVEKEAEYASQVTGVRKEYLMGMLAVETAVGQNVGECTYKQVSDEAEKLHQDGVLSARSWKTFEKRREQIKDLATELGYDYERVKVSCNPDQKLYVGTGGALGLPQFMPDTWYEYKERLSVLTGKEHPDPWSTHDGVLAMALKLSDVPGVKDHNPYAERRASKLYLSGSSSSEYDWYAEAAQYWADNYHELLTMDNPKTLEGFL